MRWSSWQRCVNLYNRHITHKAIYMKIDKLIDNGNKSLILCLSGWSTTPELFNHLELPEGCDLWIGYDYRDISFGEDLTRYEDIHLIAWSLGVWVADYLWGDKELFTTATAINGTASPIDESYGIPPAIFKGTLDNITEDRMRRFNRRMCGDRDSLLRYEALPSRSIDEKREELERLYHYISENGNNDSKGYRSRIWKLAIISKGDKIFPAANMRNYWDGICPTVEIEAAHLPFFKCQKWEELWRL